MTSRFNLEHSECRSCGAPIIWMRTTAGKRIPVDPDDVDEGDLDYNDHGEAIFRPKEHVSHFATCPDASRWRTQ